MSRAREIMVREAVATQAHDAAENRRRFGRHRVMLSAKLYTIHGLASVVLLDLSEGGAMVKAPLPLPKGSSVVLARGGLEAHGTIAWTEGRRLGIEFDEALDEAAVADTVSATARVAH